MLRHERMSVAMALAAATHHSAQRGEWRDWYEAPRGQRTASAEATYDALRSQTTSVAGDTEFFSLFEEELGGSRPDRLSEVRPQGRVQRHTVEQIVDTVLFAPSLDVPVPQMDDQLVDVCRQLDVRIPKQAIEVPKISSPARPCRRRVRFAEQTAEQLVEVPTIISYSSLQRTVVQNVNIPVPGRGVQLVGLQGFLPRQSSRTSSFSLERSSERTVEQIVDSRVLGGVSSASSSGEKSAKVGPHSSPGVPASVSPSTSSAQLEGFFIDENDDVWMRLPSGQWMLLGSDQHVLRDEPGWGFSGCSGWYVSVIMQLQFQQFVEQWRVLYSSSTVWWVLPLCNRNRYAQFETVHMDWIDMPVVVHVKVVDISGVAQTQIPMVHFSRDSTVTVH